MNKLSICLIVKNEEGVLECCLEWTSKVADELIVVDTGSDDNTVTIAKRYTSNVYYYPWQDSFAKARNFSYSKATCDYIMWVDADDVVDNDNLNRFLELKENINDNIDVIFTIYRNYTKSGIGDYILRDRIIKRSLSPKWDGDVHEAIPIDKSWECMYATNITIIHKKEYVNDAYRNINIFNKNIKEAKPLSPFEKVNYCKELVLFHQYDKAYDIYQEIKNTNSFEILYYPFSFLAKGLIEDKRYEDCIKEIEYLKEKVPITAYMVYLQGICYENLKRIDKAKKCYQKAMTIPEDPTTLEIQYNGYNDYFPMLRLALLTFKESNINKAYEYVNKAAELYPKHDEWKKIKLQLLLMSRK